MVSLEVIVGKVGNSLKITIPTPIIKKLGINKGDILSMNIKEKNIVIKKLNV